MKSEKTDSLNNTKAKYQIKEEKADEKIFKYLSHYDVINSGPIPEDQVNRMIVLKRIKGEPDYCKIYVPPDAKICQFVMEFCGTDVKYELGIKNNCERDYWLSTLLETLWRWLMPQDMKTRLLIQGIMLKLSRHN